MTTEEKTFNLLSYDDEQTANTVCKFLTTEFVYTSDGKATVVHRPGKELPPLKVTKSGTKAAVKVAKRGKVLSRKYRDRWDIVMPKHMQQYTTSLHRCQEAAGDFLKGYEAGREDYEDVE